MSEEKVIQVIVPEALKDPKEFDLWRFRIEKGNFIFDFAKQEDETNSTLVSSVTIKAEALGSFAKQFLGTLYKAEKENLLPVKLFEEGNSGQKKQGRNV